MQRLPSDPQEAFRAGLAEAADPGWAGPNEWLMLTTRRLSGLGDAAGAYETGRVLRAIARLLDAAGAPEAVGRQFRDNVAAALIAHRSKGRPEPWDGAATVDMFMEMYGRVLGFEDAAFERVRDRLLAAAQASPPPPGAAAASPLVGT
jgi:hypothetical protein